MEISNVTHIPITRQPPANDTRPGAIRFGIPKDVLDDANARERAGLNTICRDLTRPERFETVTAMIPGEPYPRQATVMCAPIDRQNVLVRFHDHGPDRQAPLSVWVHLTQLTYPNRNARAGVK